MGLKRQQLLGHKLRTYSGAGVPVDGASGTGAGRAEVGSLYINTSTGQVLQNKGTKAAPVWKPATTLLTVASVGRVGAGALALAGALVGDRVVTAYNMTDLTDSATGFETTISVAGQIQQSSAADLSLKKHLFQLQR